MVFDARQGNNFCFDLIWQFKSIVAVTTSIITPTLAYITQGMGQKLVKGVVLAVDIIRVVECIELI